MTRQSTVEKKLSEVVSSLEFIPTPAMRDCKSAFWLAIEENPIVDMSNITLAGIVQLTGQARVNDWWKKPGFQEWFTNKEEWKIKLESAAHLALNTLTEILRNPDANASARVAAAKLLVEASGKVSRQSTEVSDKMIQSMSQEQLEAYIQKRLPGGDNE